MWIMLQSKKQSRYGALKLLDFASTRFATPCEKLVDLGGLKHIFGAFMGKARIKGPGGESLGVWEEQLGKGLGVEEHWGGGWTWGLEAHLRVVHGKGTHKGPGGEDPEALGVWAAGPHREQRKGEGAGKLGGLKLIFGAIMGKARTRGPRGKSLGVWEGRQQAGYHRGREGRRSKWRPYLGCSNTETQIVPRTPYATLFRVRCSSLCFIHTIRAALPI